MIYPIRCVQKERFNKPYQLNQKLIQVNIYTFCSPITKLRYVIRAEYFNSDCVALKFYAKIHKRSKHKFKIATNKGDARSVLKTVASVIPEVIQDFSTASILIHGSVGRDMVTNREEQLQQTQRFKIYSWYLKQLIETQRYTHFEDSTISTYVLLHESKSEDLTYLGALREYFSELYDF